jgi:hypothetical protein
VIKQHARARRRKADSHQLAVDADLVVGTDFLTDFGRLPVDGDPSGDD